MKLSKEEEVFYNKIAKEYRKAIEIPLYNFYKFRQALDKKFDSGQISLEDFNAQTDLSMEKYLEQIEKANQKYDKSMEKIKTWKKSLKVSKDK